MTKTLTALMTTAALAVAAPAMAGDYKKSQMKASMSMDDNFNAIDMDDDRQITMTEFSDYVGKLGYDRSEIESEYIRLTGGGNVTLTDATFAGIDARMLQHKHLGDATHASMMKPSPTYSNSTYSTASAPMVTATSMVDADFASYDMNTDGRVDFAEYSQHARKKGMTTTQAAQLFTKMTDGQSYLDQGRFLSAMSLGSDYYLSNSTYTPNTAVLNSTTVNTTNGGLMMENKVTSPDLITNTSDYNYTSTGTYSTGSMPSATTEPMYRPEDKVLGDLTRTPSTTTMTQDYPSSYDGTLDTDSTIDLETNTDYDLD